MDLKNQKGFTIIEQLKPKIIIPTHYTTKSLETMKARYGNLTEFDNILEITKEDLPDSILNVYRILNNHKFE